MDKIKEILEDKPKKEESKVVAVVTPDINDEKNKQSLAVLSDVVHAMMNDDTAGYDEKIDEAIDKHCRNDVKCTPYGYIKRAQMSCGSPLLGDIIQEIDKRAECAAGKMENISEANKIVLIKSLPFENNPEYDELRGRINEAVTKKIVSDVKKEYDKSKETPSFKNSVVDDIETVANSIGGTEETSKEVGPTEQSEGVSESAIIMRSSQLIQESYRSLNDTPISFEEATETAIIEFCIEQMDQLFKMNSYINQPSKFNF